jgi:phosphatidylinositol alpha-1,6-mannosyltransferase
VSGPRRHVLLTPGLDGADGIAAVSREALRALAEDGTPVEVWSLARTSRARFAAWGAAAAVRGGRGVHVLSMHLRLAPVALPLVVRGARLSVFLHGIEAWRPLRRLETAAVRRAGVVLANSAFTAARFAEINPGLAPRLTVCHLGVTAAMTPGPELVRPGYVLIVGRMAAEERYKGHDQLIDAWPAVLERFASARLVVAGDGDDRARLESRVTRMGLADAIRFVGQVTDTELHALYRDAAFLALPSRGEGFGIVLLEAMRAGRACLAGRGAAEEIVTDGVTGAIVDPLDPAALRAALFRLLGEAAVCARLGAAGALRFAERFTAPQFRARLRAGLGLAPAPPTAAGASADAGPG